MKASIRKFQAVVLFVRKVSDQIWYQIFVLFNIKWYVMVEWKVTVKGDFFRKRTVTTV